MSSEGRSQLTSTTSNGDYKLTLEANCNCSGGSQPPASLSLNDRLEDDQLDNDLTVGYRSVATNTSKDVSMSPISSYDNDKEYSCGLCSIRPNWLQRFANKQTFLAIFCLTSVLQGMYYTYFVSVLTTIEKLYQIQSKTTGMIMSATEIGQIGGALLLTYYGGHGHRPKWIACGMLIFACASLLCSTPHYLFGSEVGPHLSLSQHAGQDAVSVKLEQMRSNLCSPPTSPSNSYDSIASFHNSTYEVTGKITSKCDHPDQIDTKLKIRQIVLSIFFVSLLLIGIGATAVNTLGIPYIDDNVAPRESPLYFGITIGVRIFGPVCGFLLGSVCTSVYVNFPFGQSSLLPNDPQWIGAWWLGVFIVGISLALTSIPMMVFPRRLPQPDPSSFCHIQQQRSIAEQQQLIANGKSNVDELAVVKQIKEDNMYAKKSNKPTLKNFPTAMKRLLNNDILLYRTASSVLHILPIAGLYTFLPKYLESQFQLTATTANMISGMAGIFVMGIGIFASGIYMRKYKPNARFVARWIAAAALLYAIGMVILMLVGCPLNNFVGLNVDSKGEINHNTSQCTEVCSCPIGVFSPMCTSEGITYLSPCLAGCNTVNSTDANSIEQYVYLDCKCLSPTVTAKNGLCPLQCNNLVWYIIIFSLFVLIHSTSEVGSMLLTLRCVDPQDKAMALGLISFAIGLFGNVPCPIIYGAVVDSACLFWEDNCGKPGACRVYDPVKFRQVFHGVTAVIMLAAFLVDVVVCCKAKSIQFHEEEDNEQEATPNNVGPNQETESVL